MQNIPIVINQSLFFSLTKLPSQGVPFEGTIVDDWKFDYSSRDARRMVCNDQADMTGSLLAGSLTFDCRIMHYIIVHILLPRSSNLAQASEGGLDFDMGFPYRSLDRLGSLG